CGQGEYLDQHNSYFAYGPRLARSLKVNYLVSGVSGIGIYRTWNKEFPSMPMVYKNARFQLKDDDSWDFSLYSPEVVSIALGTNDLSRGDGVNERQAFDSAHFVRKYISFIQSVKTVYPNAKIALLSSPMLKGDDRQILQGCLTTIKAHIDALYPTSKPVATYFFKPMEARGCTGHPSVEDHAILADELKGFFEELLKEFYEVEEDKKVE
ncbi:MAG: GDSL-type esterase/lipase family protein, partial [Flavitalea sp.]